MEGDFLPASEPGGHGIPPLLCRAFVVGLQYDWHKICVKYGPMTDLLKKAREVVWLEGNPEGDYSVGLIVFGALEIILGMLAFSVALFLLILESSAGLGGMKPSHFWMIMGLLFCLSGCLIAVGYGSIRAFRWARVLMLAGSWVTLFFGTLQLALVLYILPGIYDLLADATMLSPSSAMIVLCSSMILLFILQLVLPVTAMAFYGRKGVEKTCERLNPRPCWTDQCSLPLLAMSFISVLGSLSVFLGASMNYVVFLFGHVLVGWPGFCFVLLISAGCGYVGWGAFVRRMHAWWVAYALIVLTSASMMLTFSEVDMPMLYAAMGYTPDQISQLSSIPLLTPAVLTFVVCIWGIMACIYLVWVRDSFRPERVAKEIKSYRQRRAEEQQLAAPKPLQPRMRVGD